MLRTRIILLIISVALVAGLFALPEVVVDNEAGEVQESGSTGTTETPTNPVPDDSTQEINPRDADQIRQLRQLMDIANNKEKSIIFADSLAGLYEKNSLFDSAAMFIEIIAREQPGLTAWKRAGNAYYEAFTYALDAERRKELAGKARSYFEKVLQEEPGNNEIRNRLAMTMLSTENPMEGIMLLRKIVEDDPENEQALFNLGALSMQSNQYDRAVERFESVVSLNPGNIQAHFFLGVSYLESGKKRKAREQFELVKSMDTDPEVQAAVESYLEDL